MADLTIKETLNKGKGLFTKIAIEPGKVILRFDGELVYRKDIKDFSGTEAQNLLQIGPEIYVDLKGKPWFFINHSCIPNCIIKIAANRAFLISAKLIPADSELLFDYSTTSNEGIDTFSMQCNCHQFYCRGLVSGYNSIPEDKKKEYEQLGAIPGYVKL